MDDAELLMEYAVRGSEAAFGELVDRYISLVRSTALRIIGNAHLAEEATQAVFIILAKKAGRMRKGTILSGWLYRTTRFAATRVLRSELRRGRWEGLAAAQTTAAPGEVEPVWEQLTPMLDAALAQLSEADRVAVVLRFFENKSLREVGFTLGITEGAAKKRVARALEKMRTYFSKRGVLLPAAVIGGALSGNALQAAPPGLATAVCSLAAGKGAAAGPTTLALVKGTMKAMFWSKTKFAVPFVAGLALLLSVPRIWSQQPGSLDLSFNSTLGQIDGFKDLALQPGGKIIVAGPFQAGLEVGGKWILYQGVARLNRDGSVDTTFAPFDERVVNSVGLQSDGKIVVVGLWAQANGVKPNGLVRLNRDGTMDATFDPGSGIDSARTNNIDFSVISRVVIQEDDKILISGSFKRVNGVDRGGIARLNRDGGLDSSFVPFTEPGQSVFIDALQRDGKILAHSAFPSATDSGTVATARFNSDGSRDLGYNPPPSTQVGKAMGLQSDGKILCIVSPISGRLVRLNPDGSPDNSFSGEATRSNAVAILQSVAVQKDGKILVCGRFDRFNKVPRSGIARLNADGSLNTTFDSGSGPAPLASMSVNSILFQPDGKIVIAGVFSSVNGVPRNDIARLYGHPPLRFESAAVSPNGLLQIGVRSAMAGPVRIEVSDNLLDWTPLRTVTNAANSDTVFRDPMTNATWRFYRGAIADNP